MCDNQDKNGRRFSLLIRSSLSLLFKDLRDISDRKIQFEIAEKLALPIASFYSQIDSGEAYTQLSKDFDLVKEYSVSPTLIFNEGRQRLNGNVGYRVIEANIRELLNNPRDEQP